MSSFITSCNLVSSVLLFSFSRPLHSVAEEGINGDVGRRLMTGYYGAFSTSASNFPGKIQANNIDTSYKTILTRLYNNGKI